MDDSTIKEIVSYVKGYSDADNELDKGECEREISKCFREILDLYGTSGIVKAHRSLMDKLGKYKTRDIVRMLLFEEKYVISKYSKKKLP